MGTSLRIICYVVLCTSFNLGPYVQSETPAGSSYSKQRAAKNGFKTESGSNSHFNPFDRRRIPRALLRDFDEVSSLMGGQKDKWLCEAGEKYCLYVSSIEKNWLDASKSCSAVGGMLPFWMGFEEHTADLFRDETIATSWCSLYWDAGRGHEFNEDAYSPTYSGYLSVNDAVLRHIAKGEHWFSISSRYASDPSNGMTISSSPYKALGHKRNSTLPFLCVTVQDKFNETQRKLRLPLKVVIDIEIQKIAGPDPGTEALRCVPNFKDAYNKTDRPFNIVWILDGAYYPKEGLKHDDHSTTINVPYKHFTKYACEVRYLGSFYGNRSQVIEVPTPSRGKLGLLIRVRNAPFSPSSLNYVLPIKKLVEAINNDPRAFNLSRVGYPLFEENGSELSITDYMFSNTVQEGEQKHMISYEKQIESLNALLSGSFINRETHYKENTLKAIVYFENLIRNGTLVRVQFFSVDRCPLERSGDKPAEICLDENHYSINRTTGTFCHAESLGNLTWIETPLGRTTFSREGCLFEGGSLVQRTCIGDIYHGAYWGPTQAWNAEGQLLNLTNEFICASPSETTSWLLNITKNKKNATSTLAELQQVTSQWSPIIADVQLTALIFSDASREEPEFSQMNVEHAASIIEQILNVNTDILASAQRIPNVSTNLLMGIVEILTRTHARKSTLISSPLGFNTVELTGSSAVLFTANSSKFGEADDTVANTSVIRSISPAVTDNHHHDALVVLNGSSLMVSSMHASRIAFVYHPNRRLADAAVAAGETYVKVYSPNPSDGDNDILRTAKHTANSAMVQVAVGGGPVYTISEPVQIYLRPFRAVDTSNSNNSVVCAFWNPEVNNNHGGWSTQDCSYQGTVNGLVHCQCNHLSSFTSFFAYDYYEPTSHNSTRDTLTMIECGLGLIVCMGVIVSYRLYLKWRKPKSEYNGHQKGFYFDSIPNPTACQHMAFSIGNPGAALFAQNLPIQGKKCCTRVPNGKRQ